jgi:hypothetical protein
METAVKEKDANTDSAEQVVIDFESISENSSGAEMLDIADRAEAMLEAAPHLVDFIGESAWSPKILNGFSALINMLTETVQDTVRALGCERARLASEKKALLQKLSQEQKDGVGTTGAYRLLGFLSQTSDKGRQKQVLKTLESLGQACTEVHQIQSFSQQDLDDIGRRCGVDTEPVRHANAHVLEAGKRRVSDILVSLGRICQDGDLPES